MCEDQLLVFFATFNYCRLRMGFLYLIQFPSLHRNRFANNLCGSYCLIFTNLPKSYRCLSNMIATLKDYSSFINSCKDSESKATGCFDLSATSASNFLSRNPKKFFGPYTNYVIPVYQLVSTVANVVFFPYLN